ncbi:MAG: type III secretion system chaperone [Succinivibrio sp.]|nr:type III secretion system chaperone [Succinivibrio sp.]
MNSAELIDELAANLKIKLEFSKNGCCGVFFDDDEICFEMHESQLYLIAELGAFSKSEKACKRLLEANYLGIQTGQAVLGFDSQHESVNLHRIIDGNLSYTEFEKILTDFVQAARYWKKWLSEGESAAELQTVSSFPQGMRL